MGETPDQLKAEIADTRQDMSATLDAITDKTSPKRMASRQMGRMRRGVDGLRDKVMGNVSDMTDTVSGSASSAGDQLRQAPDALQRQTQGNPLAAGLVAFGVGLLVASVLPPSEAEKQAARAIAEKAQPVVDRAQQSAQGVAGDLRSSAQQAGQELKQSASQAADQVREQASQATGQVADTAKTAAGEVKQTAQDQRS